ncbi:MAG: carbohydrate ABC transporter permease [Anaerolineales bacterium]|nr:MAG: carbohydrate ABC transporter permease [Anaerolineales bacterium]
MRQSQRLKLGLTYVLLALWAIFCLFPIYWLIITSVKLPIAVFQGPRYLPWIDFQPSLHAWQDVLFGRFQDEVARRWTNSAIMATSSAALAVVIGSMAGYALTRFQYFVPGLKWRNNDLAFWIISQRMLPPVVIILPYIIMFRFLRLIDTHAGMILAYTVFNLPFVVWIMRDFFAGLPIDLEESALIDGASRFQAFTRIVLPLSTPGLIATYLFCLMFAWNDYLFALMLTFSRASTMPMYVAGMGSQSYGPQWWYLSALSLLTIAPMILIALLVERYITRGLVVGAIK